MERKEELNYVINSVILSHALSDCLSIMIERGYFFQDVKRAAKRYEGLIEKNNNRIFANVDDERMEMITKEIDQHTEIMNSLNKMSFKDKEELLKSLK
tara:strand:+ start:1818 stop:2111 length:294 start_codon:yes stop_codon:yes gene_type:complete